MLNPSDVYVSGGTNDLLVCWTDKVTKYDASSFYNWEQDNLPLHDLDERTHLLWEKFGHPTSALEGLQFIVSADATDSCNPLYFTTLSACINALPEVINYPILIEVASFGNLGGLNLSNKSFGYRGSLEIVNRNSANVAGATLNGASQFAGIEVDSSLKYGLASSITSPGTSVLAGAAAWVDSKFPFLTFDSFNASLFTRKEDNSVITIASSTNGYDDPRFVNPYVFTRRLDTRGNTRLTASLSSTVSPWGTFSTNYASVAEFDIEAYEKNNPDNVYDVSTLNYMTNAEIEWKAGSNIANLVSSQAAAVSYFNHLEYIKVNECNGPIYLRNFNVDGKNSIDRGIEIKNSKVTLERCSVSRCNKAGLYVDNSEVDLSKGFVAYRNYEISNGSRVGIPFEDKRNSYSSLDSYGTGIYAINSTINFTRNYDRYLGIVEDSYNSSRYSSYRTVVGDFGLASGLYLPNPSTDELYCLSRNDIGIHSINSKIIGGLSELDGENYPGAAYAVATDPTQIFCELNTEAGVKLDNSLVNLSGRLHLDGNFFGLDANNSTINTDILAARYNQSTALRFNNSKLIYNKDLYRHAYPIDVVVENFKYSTVMCLSNGQDILCNNSTIAPIQTSSMPTKFGAFVSQDCFGLDEYGSKALSPIVIQNNSDADILHARFIRLDYDPTTAESIYGLNFRVDHNSTLTLRGSNSCANTVFGPTHGGVGYNDIINCAGAYVSNNSNLRLQGPTAFANLGIDALAEDGSNIEITPHQDSHGNLLVDSFDLSDSSNHTLVELHSTRACLVANRNSKILMQDVGDYQRKWPLGAYGSSIAGEYDYVSNENETYTSGGFIQFYPNANINDADVTFKAVTDVPRYVFFTATGPVDRHLLHDTSYGGPHVSSISTGGMCIRAIGNSLVEANNVHFPATWPNTSSFAYDLDGLPPYEGPNCSRLFIWNIADNSTLKASYISVSGVHPRDAEYWGPEGEWIDSVNVPISGAPLNTPDTSSLSVLDFYGPSVSGPGVNTFSGFVNQYAKSPSSHENRGPFRLFFSVDPAANFLVGADGASGLVRQLYSQGYQPSGEVSAVDSQDFVPSSQYTSLLINDDALGLTTTYFRHPTDMLTNPDTVRVFLDDSGLNTFANAKHNTVGKSGMAKVVQGYYPIEDGFGGDSHNANDASHGLRSVNNFDLKKDN